MGSPVKEIFLINKTLQNLTLTLVLILHKTIDMRTSCTHECMFMYYIHTHAHTHLHAHTRTHTHEGQ